MEPMVTYNTINKYNEDNPSFPLNLNKFVHLLHFKTPIYEKIIQNITETWLFYELKYYFPSN